MKTKMRKKNLWIKEKPKRVSKQVKKEIEAQNNLRVEDRR